MDWKLLVDLGRPGLEDYGKIVDSIKVSAVRFVVDRKGWCLLHIIDERDDHKSQSHRNQRVVCHDAALEVPQSTCQQFSSTSKRQNMTGS